MKKFFLPLVLLLILSALFSGCEVLDADDPPYVITKPESVAGAQSGYFEFAGINFDFYNKCNKDIRRIIVSFIVYDSETETNPLIGSNVITVNYDGYISAGERKSLVISLDQYIYTAPEDPFLIDFFYVKEIVYTDGSSWSDPTGTYYTRSY